MKGWKIILLSAIFAQFSLVCVFAGGGKDSNGLKPDDYDKNGWAYKNGMWVPAPNGAVYTDDSSEEIVYREISNVEAIEAEMDTEQNGLDVNGLTPKDYDVNGWALKDGIWVASPRGALYKGSEDHNVEFLIASIVNDMSNEEKGVLKATLLYGKDAGKKAGDILNSSDKLADYGADVTAKWVSTQLDEAFTKGMGFMDALTGKWLNYGEQLDTAITEVIVKGMKVRKPKFPAKANTVTGAIQRENWITETILNELIDKMTDAEKLEFAQLINEELKNDGIEMHASVNTALVTGGIDAVRRLLGFKIYIWLSHTVKIVVKFITGKTLPISTYILISTVVSRIFTLGTIVGVISLVRTITDVPGMINPRDYDKFIPAVFMIGLSRLSLNNTGER